MDVRLGCAESVLLLWWMDLREKIPCLAVAAESIPIAVFPIIRPIRDLWSSPPLPTPAQPHSFIYAVLHCLRRDVTHLRVYSPVNSAPGLASLLPFHHHHSLRPYNGRLSPVERRGCLLCAISKPAVFSISFLPLPTLTPPSPSAPIKGEDPKDRKVPTRTTIASALVVVGGGVGEHTYTTAVLLHNALAPFLPISERRQC